MFTLNNFYQSKQWIKLITALKLERLDESGNLICWHCGKPIVRAYDAIGHHTIFLTEDNVNDYNVSMNPELIRFVHHRCHNYIHNKLGYVKPEVYLVYGSPLAGKTTYVDGVIQSGDLLIDIDRIWQAVSGQPFYVKPPKLNSVVFGIRDYLYECVKNRRGRWNNVYIIGGFPLISERERMCKMFGAREIYIDATKEECLQRLNDCNDGRDKTLWNEYIETWWNRYTPNCLYN